MGNKEQFGLQREIEMASERGAATASVQLRAYSKEYFIAKGNLIEARAIAGAAKIQLIELRSFLSPDPAGDSFSKVSEAADRIEALLQNIQNLGK